MDRTRMDTGFRLASLPGVPLCRIIAKGCPTAARFIILLHCQSILALCIRDMGKTESS
jgi:hypothetical protein